jgi:hypothetical protein
MKYAKVTDANDTLRTGLLKAVKAKQANGTYASACATYAVNKSWHLPYMLYRIPQAGHSGNKLFVTTGGTL